MKPNIDKHQFYMDLEPSTGTTIGLAARVQINFAINKGPGFRYRNIPNIVFPVLWQEVEMQMTESVASELWLASHAPNIITQVTSYTMFSIGFLILFAAGFIAVISFIKAIRSSDATSKSDDQLNNAVTIKRTERLSSISQVCYYNLFKPLR